jgi:Histidine kinase-, DNA gyrase B-, and HSP90-like ATPase
MDIYKERSTSNIYLAIMGILAVLFSFLYTNNLANKLAEEEANKVTYWLKAVEGLGKEPNENCDVDLELEILKTNKTIPVILTDTDDIVVDLRNFGALDTANAATKQQLLAEVKKENIPPIKGTSYIIYYKHSLLLSQLQYYPIIQLGILAFFLAFGYMSLNFSRRAEQDKVWVGMAKETAHQLGTPISGLVAWVEHLKMMNEHDEGTMEILKEFSTDIDRLQLVADRFSKIGSAPELVATNVYEIMNTCRAYMQRRAPRKVVFDFAPEPETPILAQINAPLFEWVVENLLRNAIDAMEEGKGTISIKIYTNNKMVCIDIKDTGKGIPTNKFHTVFKPGYTTKKRGWGLGLSLTKRIVDEYHNGKIFVKESVVGEGTTFTIQLKKIDEV